MNQRPDWKPKIEIAARSAFARAVREIGAENLCGFALYTDESAMSLSATVNTEAHFNAVTADNPAESVYYRWYPPEWYEEGFAEDSFAEINELLLSNFENDVTDTELEILTSEFFEECVRGLESLKKELPPEINENFIMVFDISDYEDSERIVGWAKRLNDAEKVREFRERASARQPEQQTDARR